MKTVLDLFSGLGGFSQAFAEDDEWEVIEVELLEEFDPDIQADILELGPQDLPEADIILASPPCKHFSVASCYDHWEDGEPITDEARESVLLVYHTIGLIKALSPDYWFLENPRGMLRSVIGEPSGTVTWCQYGADVMKPTDLWGRHPPSFRYKKCYNGDPCHINVSQGDGEQTQGLQAVGGSANRAQIPKGLSEAIKYSVENTRGNPATDW